VKHAEADLAVFGGPVLFPDALHVGRPNIGDRARLDQRMWEMLDRRWLTNDGLHVQAFEHQLATSLGVRHCVATCNATAGLGLAISALGLSGEVIVPSFTFAGTVHILRWHGIIPVFCDIDPRTHLLDPARVADLITAATSGVLGVHLWGRPCEVDALGRLCAGRGLALVFDAAHAMGSTHRGCPIGGFGNAEVISFHATKVVNAFEGGAVATNDEHLADRIRALRNFGFAGQDYPDGIGVNAKMSEASAAMGLTSLESMDEFIAVNRHHYQRYVGRLSGVPGLQFVDPDGMSATNYHYVVLEVDADRFGLTRDELLAVLAADGILARRYFYPGCHRIEPYRSAASAGNLDVTERVAERVLQLPTGTAVHDQDIERVCGLVRFVADHAGAIRRRLQMGSRA
jgi:dTDP-4-amino-4,6-dideoxygalactose transaminase